MPFVESVYALDRGGNALGGDRWSRGSPLKASGRLEFTFQLNQAQFHEGFRIVVLTAYDTTAAEFTITEPVSP